MVQTLLLLLEIHLDKLKEKVMKCSKEELEKLQGQAEAYREVVRWVRDPLPPKHLSQTQTDTMR